MIFVQMTRAIRVRVDTSLRPLARPPNQTEKSKPGAIRGRKATEPSGLAGLPVRTCGNPIFVGQDGMRAMAMAINVAHPRKDIQSGSRVDVAFLLLDGLRRPTGAKTQDVVLCALGLSGDGIPHPLALRIVDRETEQAWTDLLAHLKRRGIAGGLLLVCCDDHPALLKAAQAAFPDTPLQLSVSHRLLTLARKIDPQSRAACLAEVRQIFSAPDLDTAVARFRAWRANWMKLGHRTVGSLELDLASCLMFHRFPKDLWSKIRTVNLVERVFREARRVPQLGLPEALCDSEDSATAGEAESGIEIPVETSAAAEMPLPLESPATVELPALAEPLAVTDEPAWRDDAAAVSEAAVAALEAAIATPEAAVSVPETAAPAAVSSEVFTQRVAQAHAVDLSRDPDFMWWLGQYRRAHTHHSRLIAVVMSLVGLMAGLVLARGL